MQITITGLHLEITPALRAYVEEKLQKVHKRSQEITHIHVTLSVDKKYQQKAEAELHLPKTEINASAEAKDLYAAIDLLIDKLDRQVTKHKERSSDRERGERAERDEYDERDENEE